MKLSNTTLTKQFCGIFCILFIVVSLSSCQPLRQKFIRQKRKDKKEVRFIPVLEPIDYPEKVQSTQQKYSHHFSTWLVWEKELQVAMSGKASKKRQLYMLNQVIVNVEEMQKLIKGEPEQKLKTFLRDLEKIRASYDLSEPFRGDKRNQLKLNAIAKELRNNFRWRHVEKHF